MNDYPVLVQTVVDTGDPRRSAEFYRELLGLRYRLGDAAPETGADDADWLVLTDSEGQPQLAFQQVDGLPVSTWPEDGVPQQLHLDFKVPDAEALSRQRERAISLGATVRLDRSDDADEPLYVFADPDGHPFCIFVA